ncbi:hypothetical protein BX616_007731 [Lobosporangium transversale]|uniref:Dymeclin n=1 Tax=Lobosporangium transversale TaxID=64571 RepID=A0A1Y2GQ43_9FUNG|nr:hypothetical protein BCR41DRAFT_370499 [Lobosporangium transversale]KAF9918575.1 hypothetical protein BX616_007731 [Lobosporangium transversale]ORZ16714.1 hypothetical protein BCR41DRAFT_370499 [Lobosporangium transversale]|eukprot:XP_021881649.1 hypothetical protein BCR41DRAFT_370499 [Lobosporangium transversale]
MTTTSGLARSSSPSSAFESAAALAPIAQIHQHSQEHAALPLHRLESSSGILLSSTQKPNTTATSTVGTHTSGYDIALVHHRNSVEYRAGYNSPFVSDLPASDNNTYTGRPVLDSSRRYSSGQGSIHPSPFIEGSATIASRRQAKLGGQIPTLAPTLETPASSAIRNSNSSINAAAADFHSSFDQDFQHHPHPQSSHGAFGSGPHSPAYSISSLSGIIPGSASISSIASTAQTKPPALEHKHPITIKEFENILILGPAQQVAIKTLCSPRILSRIDTIGWYSILGAQKFPTINSSQDAYDIEMATTYAAIEFGSNNPQTQNFNTLVLQLISQLKLIKDQDYKGDIPNHAYNALFLTRIFLNHFISHLSSTEMVAFFEGSNLSVEAQQEALGIVSFKGCKIGVDQTLVSDPRSYAEQLIQEVLGIILNLDAGSTSSAYEFYEETLNLMIVMSSTQLQLTSAEPNEKNYFLNLVLQNFRSAHVCGSYSEAYYRVSEEED